MYVVLVCPIFYHDEMSTKLIIALFYSISSFTLYYNLPWLKVSIFQYFLSFKL
uniref:Uncharacterized protein n=1 Tax=Rhizophora mucronata TaxID=61149 RepID=A0A2P2PEK0_RHIMU